MSAVFAPGQAWPHRRGPEFIRQALWEWNRDGYCTLVHSDPRVARSPRCTGPAQWSWVDQAAWSSNTQEVGVPIAQADRMELTNSATDTPGSGMNPSAWASSVHNVPMVPPKRCRRTQGPWQWRSCVHLETG